MKNEKSVNFYDIILGFFFANEKWKCNEHQLRWNKVVSFLSVAKDLTHRWINMVLLYSEASYKSWEGFKLFLERVSSTPSPKKYIFYSFETQIWNGMRSTFPPITLSAPRGFYGR